MINNDKPITTEKGKITVALRIIQIILNNMNIYIFLKYNI